MKCPKDSKRCYVHVDGDGFAQRCRHGEFFEATFCPYQIKQMEKEELEKGKK